MKFWQSSDKPKPVTNNNALAVNDIINSLRGRRVCQLSMSEKDKLIEALCRILDIVNDKGEIQ